jgi:hypothetical protein
MPLFPCQSALQRVERVRQRLADKPSLLIGVRFAQSRFARLRFALQKSAFVRSGTIEASLALQASTRRRRLTAEEVEMLWVGHLFRGPVFSRPAAAWLGAFFASRSATRESAANACSTFPSSAAS